MSLSQDNYMYVEQIISISRLASWKSQFGEEMPRILFPWWVALRMSEAGLTLHIHPHKMNEKNIAEHFKALCRSFQLENGIIHFRNDAVLSQASLIVGCLISIWGVKKAVASFIRLA